MSPLAILEAIAAGSGARRTEGLSRPVVSDFLARDPQLSTAIEQAWTVFEEIRGTRPELLALAEGDLVARLQDGIVNFYPAGGVSPYVPLAAKGPWVVTAHGAIIHDSGGYGMLGLGHNPDALADALGRDQVMANVMTASFAQGRLVEALRAEIGQNRGGGCPFESFVCLNSGSESMTLAARLGDANAKRLTAPGGRQEGKAGRLLSLRGAFHGRTDRPAQFSDSTLPKYRQYLKTFAERDNLVTIAINDVAALEQAFADVAASGAFFESFFFEPVQGEGNPGAAMTPAFYARARQLCDAAGTLLVADSIQAGLRTWGVLSITDYPGFEGLAAPDIESYSKALNAGQYPLSVLGLGPRAVQLHRTGLYGNTMTTNPRAVDVAVALLAAVTPELRANIRARGEQLKERLTALAAELGSAAGIVQGTGLIASLELSPSLQVEGHGGIEEALRLRGFNVIHGGSNALRFTPWFGITEAEVDLLVEQVGAVVRGRLSAAA